MPNLKSKNSLMSHALKRKGSTEELTWLAVVNIHNFLSQNHRISEVGREHLRLSSPIPVFKKGQLEQTAQDHVQSDFAYLHRWKHHSLSGLSVPIFAEIPIAINC